MRQGKWLRNQYLQLHLRRYQPLGINYTQQYRNGKKYKHDQKRGISLSMTTFHLKPNQLSQKLYLITSIGSLQQYPALLSLVSGTSKIWVITMYRLYVWALPQIMVTMSDSSKNDWMYQDQDQRTPIHTFMQQLRRLQSQPVAPTPMQAQTSRMTLIVSISPHRILAIILHPHTCNMNIKISSPRWMPHNIIQGSAGAYIMQAAVAMAWCPNIMLQKSWNQCRSKKSWVKKHGPFRNNGIHEQGCPALGEEVSLPPSPLAEQALEQEGVAKKPIEQQDLHRRIVTDKDVEQLEQGIDDHQNPKFPSHEFASELHFGVGIEEGGASIELPHRCQSIYYIEVIFDQLQWLSVVIPYTIGFKGSLYH